VDAPACLAQDDCDAMLVVCPDLKCGESLFLWVGSSS